MSDPPAPDPLDASRVFVSYASADLAQARAVVDVLNRAGVQSWLDRDGIPGGASYGPEIVAAIKDSGAVLLLCSAVAFASRNVRQEIQLAWRHGRPILPLRLESAPIPEALEYWLEGCQWIELLDRPEAAWLPEVHGALARLRVASPPFPGLEVDPPALPASPAAERDRTMPELPAGTVTFLFTDIEGSTRLWQEHPAGMSAAIARHDTLLHQVVADHGGVVFKTVGDAVCAAFAAAPDAVAAALASQRALAAESWGATGPLRVRMALHTGVAEVRDGDYFGQPLNRVARLLAAGHGGQILLSQTAHGLVRDSLPAGASVRDLGEHRLKDLLDPEHISQLLHPALPGDFPPLKTLDARPHNLPLQPTPLVGREREVAEAVAALRRPEVRLLTLTGPGGTGKTRLGLQVAADLIDEFPDGVIFVALAPVSDPALAPAAVADALGVREDGARPLRDRIMDELRSKQLLLVLDNFEQIAAAAPIVTEWLGAAPQLKVLVTSRSILRLRAEHEQQVPPLGLPARGERQSPAQVNESGAVRLFVARARAARADFTLTAENAPIVAEICHRLDGLPLAIELAAARIRLLPPQTMLTRLEQRLGLLTGGARDLPERQQTLRGAITWSYDLLTPAEQALFRRLAVFVGGGTLEAVEAVGSAAGSGDLDLDLLERLVDHSLLRQVEGIDGEPRFTMLETVREYGVEQLSACAEGEEIRARHAAFFLALAERAEPALSTPEQGTWLARLAADHDNLRAALDWTFGHDIETGLRLAGALWRFWYVRGPLSEGRSWLERAIAVGVEASPAARAKVFDGAGTLTWAQGDLKQAQDWSEESLSLYREVGDTDGIASALNGVGIAACDGGDYLRATEVLEEALTLRRGKGNLRNIGLALGNLAEVARGQGDYDRAGTLNDQAFPLLRVHADPRLMAEALANIGIVAAERGDTAQAAARLTDCILAARTVGTRPAMAMGMEGMAALANRTGRVVQAARLFGAAAGLRTATGTVPRPLNAAWYEASVAAVREALGTSAFAAAWEAGLALSLEDAVAEALALTDERTAGTDRGVVDTPLK